MRVAACLLALTACGSTPPNKMLDRSSPVVAIQGPHLAVFVETKDGLARVWLDTGASELVSRTPGSRVLDEATFVHVEDGHYVIERNGDRRVIPDVKPSYRSGVSPDGAHLAVVHTIEPAPIDRMQPTEELVIIALGTGDVRRIPIPVTGPDRSHVSFDWARTGDALLVHYDGWKRLDLATGAVSAITVQDYKADRAAATLTECPSRGLRLVERTADKQQQIVLEATAPAADPERLSATTDRVLVASTHNRGFPSDHAVHFGRSRAGPLQVHMFTPSCEHFLFTLEGAVYIGEVATGRHAKLIEGSQPVLLRPR